MDIDLKITFSREEILRMCLDNVNNMAFPTMPGKFVASFRPYRDDMVEVVLAEEPVAAPVEIE